MSRVRTAGAVALVAVFFTNVALYAFTTDRLAWPPLTFALPLVLLAVPWVPGLVLREGWSSARRVAWWSAFVVGIALLGFVTRPATPLLTQHLLRRGLAVAFLLAAVALLVEPRARSAARAAIAVAVLAAVALNLYDVVRPLSFSVVLSRAAGLYLNPNISAAALAAGALVSITRVPTRWRAAFFLGTTVGILATLSRGVLLAWGVAGLLLVIRREVRLRQLARTVVLAALLVALGATWWRTRPVPPEAVDSAMITSRWSRLLPPRLQDELAVADAQRLEVAREAWRMFQERPLVGHGLGATVEWTLPESTHNTYLRGAAEEGVPGLLLLPLLVAALALGPAGGEPSRIPFAAFLAVLGFFTHNLLEEWPLLVATAVAASAPDAAGEGGDDG